MELARLFLGQLSPVVESRGSHCEAPPAVGQRHCGVNVGICRAQQGERRRFKGAEAWPDLPLWNEACGDLWLFGAPHRPFVVNNAT